MNAAKQRQVLAALAFLALLVFGGWLRFRTAGTNPLWVDEAESSINALTILEHGYPTSTYLDAPIYENTLVKPWPESQEFEFRDSSYSDRGLVIYHAWLPLYAIAASFKLYGIEPDRNDGRLHVRHRGDDLKRRTLAARMPSLVFSIVLLIAIFFAGRDMGPFPASWLALLFAVVTPTIIWYGQQARYYSLTVTLSVVCIHALWAVAVRQKWINIAVAWLAMTLLFHTHLITFATAALVMTVASVFLIRTREGTLKAAALWLAIGISCLPWLLGSGFLTATRDIPAGWKFLSLPHDLLAPLLARPRDVALVLIPLVLFVPGVRKLIRTLSNGPGQSIAVLLLVVWVAAGYFAFYFLMPAASQFPDRMKLSFIGPCLLLQAMAVAFVAQIVSSRWGKIAGLAILCLLVWEADRVRSAPLRITPASGRFQILDAVVAHLDSIKIEPGTKLFGTPNHHLILTFYTGLPVVSIAPIRKSFLDEYPHRVVFFEPIAFPDELTVFKALQKAAEPTGETHASAVAEWVSAVQTYEIRKRLSQSTAKVIPPLETLPEFAMRALAAIPGNPPRLNSRLRIPMLRGFELPDYTSWWPIFMYRFVEPHERIGDKFNYRDRMRNATAELVKDAQLVVYHSPGSAQPLSADGVGEWKSMKNH